MSFIFFLCKREIGSNLLGVIEKHRFPVCGDFSSWSFILLTVVMGNPILFLYVIFSINFSLADIENYLDGGTGCSRTSRRDRKQMGFKSIRFTARQSHLINADDLVSFQLNVQYIVFLFRFNIRIGISCAQTIDYFSLPVRIFIQIYELRKKEERIRIRNKWTKEKH